MDTKTHDSILLFGVKIRSHRSSILYMILRMHNISRPAELHRMRGRDEERWKGQRGVQGRIRLFPYVLSLGGFPSLLTTACWPAQFMFITVNEPHRNILQHACLLYSEENFRFLFSGEWISGLEEVYVSIFTFPAISLTVIDTWVVTVWKCRSAYESYEIFH
jgi:hypothetical protein